MASCPLTLKGGISSLFDEALFVRTPGRNPGKAISGDPSELDSRLLHGGLLSKHPSCVLDVRLRLAGLMSMSQSADALSSMSLEFSALSNWAWINE